MLRGLNYLRVIQPRGCADVSRFRHRAVNSCPPTSIFDAYSRLAYSGLGKLAGVGGPRDNRQDSGGARPKARLLVLHFTLRAEGGYLTGKAGD